MLAFSLIFHFLCLSSPHCKFLWRPKWGLLFGWGRPSRKGFFFRVCSNSVVMHFKHQAFSSPLLCPILDVFPGLVVWEVGKDWWMGKGDVREILWLQRFSLWYVFLFVCMERQTDSRGGCRLDCGECTIIEMVTLIASFGPFYWYLRYINKTNSCP